jgi:acyl-CoA synthetase (AMP-forming)/AMP-acid ligase II
VLFLIILGIFLLPFGNIIVYCILFMQVFILQENSVTFLVILWYHGNTIMVILLGVLIPVL